MQLHGVAVAINTQYHKVKQICINMLVANNTV